jgi:hypothetical protein
MDRQFIENLLHYYGIFTIESRDVRPDGWLRRHDQGKVMDQQIITDLDQVDEEILTYTVSDCAAPCHQGAAGDRIRERGRDRQRALLLVIGGPGERGSSPGAELRSGGSGGRGIATSQPTACPQLGNDKDQRLRWALSTQLVERGTRGDAEPQGISAPRCSPWGKSRVRTYTTPPGPEVA